jgi:arylsulfatase A
MELDWSVGQILSTLERLGIDEQTLVIFTSDNGPWLSYGDHAGSAKPLREGKTTTFDGGQRVPAIMRWPGKIPAGGLCRELVTAMDILPTFAWIAGADLPPLSIDGKDIWPLMSGQGGAKSPHKAVFYYNVWKLEAVRSGKWKLHLPQEIDLALFDLDKDISEQRDVSADHPEVVERLLALAENARRDIGDAEKKVIEGKDFFDSRTFYRIKGKNARPPGHI